MTIELENVQTFRNRDFTDYTYDDFDDLYKEFDTNNLDAIKLVQFENCRFHNYSSQLLHINANFTECTFNNINIYELSESISFINCNITKVLISSSIDLKGAFSISNTKSETNTIGTVEISNSVLKGSFSIKNIDIGFLNISNTNFEELFEFHNITIKDIGSSDGIIFDEIIFKGIAIFDDCTFDVNAIFKYVLFEKFSQFRNTTFHSGINLDYCSYDKNINFFHIQGLETKTSKENTSQETYRIIKHNFEQLANKIEANKYHALELKKLRSNTPWYTPNYLVQLIHLISSNNSQWWLLSLFWIFVVGLSTFFSIDNFVCHRFSCTSNWLDYFKYISIINLDNCIKENPLIFILNKISLGYLYYQFLMSVRKDTRK
ncbi:pentapeptide repeat-containing protein [Arcobacteraceae bacterium]|nr:pentapeptide repeat-containing protein [Arcobacteraceae bacterium]